MVDAIRKNKLDLKYQLFSSLGLKALGLAISIPVGLAGLRIFRESTVLLVKLGGFVSAALFLLATASLTNSWKYLKELDSLKD